MLGTKICTVLTTDRKIPIMVRQKLYFVFTACNSEKILCLYFSQKFQINQETVAKDSNWLLRTNLYSDLAGFQSPIALLQISSEVTLRFFNTIEDI